MKRALGNFFGALAAAMFAADAAAATMEQALARCKEQLTPAMRECVRQKMVANSDRSPEKYIPGCRSSVKPQFDACVTKIIGATGFKKQIDEAKTPAQTPAVSAAPRVPSTPPRTIADITAILDGEKPDPVRVKRLQATADAAGPPKGDQLEQAHFFNRRAQARAELGRTSDAMADGRRAVELASGKADVSVVNSFRTTLAVQHLNAGEPKLALDVLLAMAEATEKSRSKGSLFTAYRLIASVCLTLGDLERADSYVQKLEALLKNGNAIPGFADHGGTWRSGVEEARGRLLEARGQLEPALRQYQQAEQLRRANIEKSARSVIPVPRAQNEQAADILLASIAQAKTKLGRLAEAEGDARRALLNRLNASGKYAPQTARFIAGLGRLLVEQGRYEEAKKLIAATIDIYGEIGMAEDAQPFVAAMSNLASVQALEGQWQDAATSYAFVERSTASWEAGRRAPFLAQFGRIEAFYRTGRLDQGMETARRLMNFRTGRYGEQHPDTALARGHYAVGLALANRRDDALREFRAAVPIITATNFNTDNDDAINAAARTRYTQAVVENFIALLAQLGPEAGPEMASDTFRLADSIRGRSVQKALTAAGARVTATDPKLAEAVRREQDLRQQIGTQLGQLNSLLALPASERDDAGVATMRKDVERMRAEHLKVRADIDRRFPDYADLIDPKPPTLAQIRETLKPGETLLSFYFGRDASFVWAIAHDGKVEFAALRENAAAVEAKIKKLRDALEPQAAMISDIPPFDLTLAHELYRTLLEPVKAGWADAKSLVVVTNGALGLLPLGLLTTAPHDLPKDGPVLFTGYRGAPWLARTHAVTMVPSASALRTLRRLPAGSPSRDKLVGFGDPWFHSKHADEPADDKMQVAAADMQTRGVPLRRRAGPQTEGADSAELGQLPRLPDTADELRSIALALEADPSKVLYLGKNANEEIVRKINLSGYKIVAFATHGLVPGEINGLDQPALALSAPDVAGVAGDGLLTMQEILSLKLDADWVVLSACNTGAGAGAGAEAASGLGRAFFYAGTRAILVTNWSVHSQSARELVTDLFRRQAADAKLTRGEALRRAAMALMDDKGFVDDKGAMLFTYAHPLFWAPYTIIGDGG